MKLVKRLTIHCLRIISLLIVSPLMASHWLLSRIAAADASIEAHSQILSCLPGLTGSYLRVAFYRIALEHCDPTATIAFGTLFSKAGARIGRHVYIGPRCMIGLVTLEDDVLLGPMIQIPSGPRTHGIDRLDIAIREQAGQPIRLVIGRDSWIGAGSIVLADVAEQTVVAAGSVVTKTHSPRSVIAGVPAKLLKERARLPFTKEN